MDDLLNRATAGRNWLERIVDRIPGFSGYQNRETRREVDRIFRGYLGRKVDDSRAALQGKIREISRRGNLDAISDLDGSEKGLDGLANRIRTADSGYSGFFDAIKVREAELDAIYRFDVEFDDTVSELARVVETVGSVGGPDASELRQAIETALARWQERANLIDLASRN